MTAPSEEVDEVSGFSLGRNQECNLKLEEEPIINGSSPDEPKLGYIKKALSVIFFCILAEATGMLIYFILRIDFDWKDYQQYIWFLLLGGIFWVIVVMVLEKCFPEQQNET